MSPNLSFEHIALVLALAGCSKATPAAETSNVRSDPQASAQAPVVGQGAATATATASAAPAMAGPGGAASATELRKKEKNSGGDGHTGQASCGAGSCTSEIKKK